MLQDFLTEAGELLAGVDNKLVELEKRPGDAALLNEIFRGFHTIKGGAGFLDLPAMVDLCHLTENIFDLLRRNEIAVDAAIMDCILAATAAVRAMFDELARGGRPQAADPWLLARLRAIVSADAARTAVAVQAADTAAEPIESQVPSPAGEPDWETFYSALTKVLPEAPPRSDTRPYG